MSEIRLYFDSLAEDYDRLKSKNWYYQYSLKDFYKSMIPEGSEVLEIGCATGEILNSVRPRRGVGLDISEKMIEVAKNKFPHFEFNACSIDKYSGKDKFDYIIMCDLLDHVSDIRRLFLDMDKTTKVNTKLIITTINPIWDRLLEIAGRLKLKMPEGRHAFVFKSDVVNLLTHFSYKVEAHGYFLLVPFYIPAVSKLFNYCAPKISFLRRLCFVQYIVASKKAVHAK